MLRIKNCNSICIFTFYSVLIYTVFKYQYSCPEKDFDFLLSGNTRSINIVQNVTECSCIRTYFYPPDQRNPNVYDSSCSNEGTFYRASQKVVSFSMHFPNQSDASLKMLYGQGISVNLARLKIFYPGYSMRMYTDEPLEGDFCLHVCSNSNFFWCDVTKSPSLGYLNTCHLIRNQSGIYFRAWRFMPLGDPTVDIFLSRDLDSAITERESAAVSDWLNNTDKAFHVMRDKKDVHNLPILAGMWGARNKLLHGDGDKLRANLLQLNGVEKRYKTLDQKTLNEVIFYPRKADIVAYDSYHCKKWSNYTLVRPFPRKRENSINDFVGNVDLGKKEFRLDSCPQECRPDYGKDWEYC